MTLAAAQKNSWKHRLLLPSPRVRELQSTIREHSRESL